VITIESAQNILHADEARCRQRKGRLLTPLGRDILTKLVDLMRPLPQSEINRLSNASRKDIHAR
jgi:hypothetical protein